MKILLILLAFAFGLGCSSIDSHETNNVQRPHYHDAINPRGR